jgi:regulator of sirC expression with transglutaminase-like and TPR domain
VPFALNLQARVPQVADELQRAVNAPGEELGPAALAIARVEYPSLDAAAYLRALDRMGREASARLGTGSVRPPDAVGALNEYVYDEQGFRGNRERYDDPRNSFLNEVLERKTGIPISLAVVYLEIARRTGVRIVGVNFPGHFLLRVPENTGDPGATSLTTPGDEVLIIDPFHGGARLSESDCRQLLRQHVGEEAAFDASLLEPATRHDIVVRMLVNLKRLYVRMRSFPQARFISDLLLTIDPSAIAELRDRGLLAYHLEDFAAALRDLEAYLRLLPRRAHVEEAMSASAESTEGADAQIWEHVKTLRKRVAGMN